MFPFGTPGKHKETYKLSDDFWGYQMETLARNGIYNQKFYSIGITESHKFTRPHDTQTILSMVQ